MYLGYNVIIDNYFNVASNNIIEQVTDYLKEKHDFNYYRLHNVDLTECLDDYETVFKFPHIKLFLFNSDNNKIFISKFFDGLQRQELLKQSKEIIETDLIINGKKNRIVLVNGLTLIRLENKDNVNLICLEGV